MPTVRKTNKNLWGKGIHRLLDHYAIPWSVVPRISLAELGSSPGDAYWDGSQLVLEKGCPPHWVAHEVAPTYPDNGQPVNLSRRDSEDLLRVLSHASEEDAGPIFSQMYKEYGGLRIHPSLER